jgi:cytochrome c
MHSGFLVSTVLLALLSGAAACDPALAAGDATKGALVFHNHCDSCHSVFAADGDGNGPNLHGIIGRKAGSMPGFEYSAAMKASGITWSGDSVTQFVKGPDAFIPGNKMARKYKGVPLEDIPDLVAYLQSKSLPAGQVPAGQAPAAAADAAPAGQPPAGQVPAAPAEAGPAAP